jgi:hypothetical protein
MKALGLCTRQALKGRIYILWDLASLMTWVSSTPANQGGLPITGDAHAISYEHVGRRTTGYMRSPESGKVLLVPDPFFLEERTVGIC